MFNHTIKHKIALYRRLRFNVEIYKLTKKNYFCTYERLELKFQSDQFFINTLLSTSGVRLQFLVSQFLGGGFLLYQKGWDL